MQSRPGLLKGSLVYGIGAAANAAAAIALLPVIVRFATPAAYGEVALVEAVVAVTTVLAVLGTNVGLLAGYSSRDDAGRHRLVSNCLGLSIISAIVTSAALTLLSPILSNTLMPSLTPAHYLLACAITLMESTTLIVAASYRARGAAWKYIRAYFVQAAVGMVTSAVLVILVAPTSISLLVGRVVGDLGALLVLAPDLWRTPPRLVRSELRGLLGISLPLVPATLASSLIVASPRIALDTVQSTDEVGRYAFAAKFGSIISLLVAQPFALAWLPTMFQMKEQGDPPERFGAVIEFYIMVAAAVGATVFKTLGAARSLLSSERFPLDMGVLAVALGANVAVGLLQAVNMGAYLRAKTSSQVPPYAVAGAVALPMAMWLGKCYGAVGAATAQLLVYCVLAGALYWVSQRLFPVKVNWRRLVFRTAFIAVAAGVSHYFTNGLGSVGKVADLVLFIVILLPIWIVVVGSWRQRIVSKSCV